MKEETKIQEIYSKLYELLNGYEIDARNITNGMTFIDSFEANKLAQEIIDLL